MTGVHSLDGNKILSSLLVSVSISENNLGKGGSSTGVVENVLDDSLNVSIKNGERRFIFGVYEKAAVLTLVSQRSQEF